MFLRKDRSEERLDVRSAGSFGTGRSEACCHIEKCGEERSPAGVAASTSLTVLGRPTGVEFYSSRKRTVCASGRTRAEGRCSYP